MVSESVSECQLSMREWLSIERACPESDGGDGMERGHGRRRLGGMTLAGFAD